MKKTGIIIGLVVVIIVLIGYIAVQNKKIEHLQVPVSQNAQVAPVAQNVTPVEGDMSAPDGGSIKYFPDEYVLVPELQIGFRKVPGLTPTYVYDPKNQDVSFSTKELNLAAQYDKGLSYCVTDLFPVVAISTVSRDQSEFQGYGQKKLADGRYLNIYGPQAVCYTDEATKEHKDLVENQAKLFSQFLNTVQSY
jgi:hypothetical protein